MTDATPTRRRVVTGLSLSALGSLAGCTDVLSGSTPTRAPPEFDALAEMKVYVDPLLSLSAPENTRRVKSGGLADVAVVPGHTDRSRSAIVHWLADGTYVAFFGDEAQATWHDVKSSGAYAAMLGRPRGRASACAGSSSGGGSDGGDTGGGGADATSDGTDARSDCEPPDLVVAWHTPDVPTETYRKTWAGTDRPGDREVFLAIDEGIAGAR